MPCSTARDFVDGVTLADQISTDRRNPEEAARLCGKVAIALHHVRKACDRSCIFQWMTGWRRVEPLGMALTLMKTTSGARSLLANFQG